MPVAWQELYARRAAGMRASDIREILKVTAQPEVISLAGGLPAPELFPIDEYRRAFEWVLEAEGPQALQYGPSEGYRPLREYLARRLETFGIRCAADDILITNGSQQALDLIGKILLDPGDAVLVEKPTYLGALQAFNQYQASYAVVPMDEDGMCVDHVEHLLASRSRARRPLKFIYAIPNFQNPTGRSMSLERRRRLVELATAYGVPIVEDDAYGELRYEGEHLPSLKSLDTSGTVIYLGTFSKILAPGFRLGWLVASQEAMEGLLHAKQPADLHTGMIQQMATYEVSRNGFVDTHVESIKAFYKERRDVMLRALEEHFPAEAHFTRPSGGLFVWAELPRHVDTRALLLDAIQDKVAFVPGQGFHPDNTGTNTMRLNFSNVPPDQLREGVRRLGHAIHRRLAAPLDSSVPV
jgi:2-aminoadipate transaminase